jgi:hypothetical protein
LLAERLENNSPQEVDASSTVLTTPFRAMQTEKFLEQLAEKNLTCTTQASILTLHSNAWNVAKAVGEVEELLVVEKKIRKERIERRRKQKQKH